MSVSFTRTARSDLIEVGDHIARFNPARAATFTQELLVACETIRDMPLAFPVLPRHERRGFRRKVFQDYLIVYSVSDGEITIVRIVHGARELTGLLDDQPT